MSGLLKKGTKVTWPTPVCSGVIERARIVEDDVQYLVGYTDVAGESHQRYFREDELTVTAEPPAEENT